MTLLNINQTKEYRLHANGFRNKYYLIIIFKISLLELKKAEHAGEV